MAKPPYPQMTPVMRARGTWSVRLPFQIVEQVEYTCIAIRSFQDMLEEGIDPYTTVYTPVGLVDGVTVDERQFSYDAERLKQINIVTLVDAKGIIIHIPDNYIISYPNTSNIAYLNYILSIDMGALPTGTDFTDLITALKDTVTVNTGVTDPEILVNSVPVSTSPTYEQHLEYERVRNAAKNLAETPSMKNLELQAKNDELEATNQALVQICLENGYIFPT